MAMPDGAFISAGGTRAPHPPPPSISTTLNTRGTREVRKGGDKNVDTTPFSLFLSIKLRSKQEEEEKKT